MPQKPSVLVEGSSDDDDDVGKENVQKKLSFSSSIDSSKNDDSSARVVDLSSIEPSSGKNSDRSASNHRKHLSRLESSLKDLKIAAQSAPRDEADEDVFSSSSDDEEV